MGVILAFIAGLMVGVLLTRGARQRQRMLDEGRGTIFDTMGH